MRVRKLGGNVELEVVMVWNILIPQFQQYLGPFLEGLLLEHRIKHGVQLLLHVLQQTGLAKPYAVLYHF